MKRVERMLVYVDDVNTLAVVLDDIVQFAGDAKISVTFAGVIEPVSWWARASGGLSAEDCAVALARELEAGIAEAISTLRTEGAEVAVKVFEGEPARVLTQAISDAGYDILVKAPSASPDRLLSSADQRLIRYAPCPVAILRPRRADSSGRIIAAVDFDPDQPAQENALNDAILNAAFKAAAAGYGDIDVLHVWQLFGESTLGGVFGRLPQKDLDDLVQSEKKLHADWLASYVTDFCQRPGPASTGLPPPRPLLVKGIPHSAIPRQVEALKADLLVIGSVGRTGAPGMLIGNTAETVLGQVNCSVLAVRPPRVSSY